MDEDILGGGALGGLSADVDGAIGSGQHIMEVIGDANDDVSHVYEMVQEPQEHY